ncbi:translation initiation factor 3 subunit H [Cryptococcus neoformans Tu401-1]|nr:translation initiation factor 3 subunit H [Cryptococcus neoformans var. grubii Bt1]OXC67666.1 hypothetical protein AYX13_03752 [Cryptococcus neoformans var. grubii]OXG17250.1 translation initiation factor 3 subunit H [Cryptococcus neoformans var. grubii Tu401-1]OXM78827.1 translation initiation factor 3 subunit H [Cryptococcus neoformans var. grubii Bt63]
MTSMAAALAASLPAAISRQATPQPAAQQPSKVPQRLEGVVDVEAAREVENVSLSSLVFLKMMKHSTDSLPAPPASVLQQDRNPPPPTELSSHVDALGVLLGLDLDGVMEVEDCYALPGGETSLGPNSYSARLLSRLGTVSTPDSPVGIYLSTHNGGFATRVSIELLSAVEKAAGRGKAILVIHDASRSNGGDLSVKAYRLADGAREAAKLGRWDGQVLTEQGITASTLLTSIPIAVSSPSLVNAFISTLNTPSPSETSVPSLTNPSVPLPPSFAPLINPLPGSLTTYLQNTLDALTLHSHEANNIAFLTRQIAREKTKHEQAIKDREEENARRRKMGLSEFPSIPEEIRGGTKEPSRLEMVCLGGTVEGIAKGMAAEAGKGLVRAYL